MKWVYKWKLISDTSGKEYTVSIADDGTFGCSCPVWTRRRMECKHIKRIKKIQRKEINDVIEAHKIPLEEDKLTRDWVKVDPDAPDVKEAVMSKLDEFVGKLKDDPIEKAMDEKLKKSSPSVMELITKNAQWRF